MIVDSSIIVALALGEPSSRWITRTIDSHPHQVLRMSWVNIAEAAMALRRENPAAPAALETLLAQASIEPLAPGWDVVHAAVEARARFPLHFGDCFAYAHAARRQEPLLTLDSDVLKTDLAAVLHPAGRAEPSRRA
ncbi:MAG: type II toxin-antitoxin system VapC family toxin [Rhodospirillaceae bacterium]|nr:type II toxin-antitoxin system VapC family toxin [Rhodospirillaceae bacterium]